MPIRRAPTRLIAVARSALPTIVRSKNTNSSADSTACAHHDERLARDRRCPTRRERESENDAVREPSAPKKQQAQTHQHAVHRDRDDEQA